MVGSLPPNRFCRSKCFGHDKLSVPPTTNIKCHATTRFPAHNSLIDIVDCNVIFFYFSLAANIHNLCVVGRATAANNVHRRVGSMVATQEQAIVRDGQLVIGGIEVAQEIKSNC